jgi:hypothetical protein
MTVAALKEMIVASKHRIVSIGGDVPHVFSKETGKP